MQVETKIIGIGEVVRKMESDYISGNTQLSKYVNHSLHETVEQIYAYIFSTHITGKEDALGREKPFFNIGTAVANIWYRATDIDRKNMRLRATKSKDWLDTFLANILLQDWMRRERFSVYLNDWGRILARFGSAVTKLIENSKGLHINAVPWNRIICDAVDFENNPKVEILELTEGELRMRIQTHGYDKEQIDDLVKAKTTRKTRDRSNKDNKAEYYKLYEFHGLKPLSMVTGDESDNDKFVQQMQVMSYVQADKRKNEFEDFVLYKGREKEDPYSIAHLIKEDGRTLSIGAFEHLFEAQWIENHSAKSIKDQLDMANLILWQTSDAAFLGHNFLMDVEQGDVMIHAPNAALSPVNNDARNVVSWQNFAISAKKTGNEAVGISEAMLGAAPKSGTAWRQTEAMLQESYSLFELMVENKANALEDLLRSRIIPYFRKQIDTTKEVSAILDAHDIERIDARYIKNISTRKVNNIILDKMEADPEYIPTPEEQEALLNKEKNTLSESLNSLGSERFFKPSDLADETWEKQFKDMEWDTIVDITGEAINTRETMATLNTVLTMTMQPGFEQNKRAQAIVGKILEVTNTMSPVEYYAIPPSAPQPTPQPAPGAAPPAQDLPEEVTT